MMNSHKHHLRAAFCSLVLATVGALSAFCAESQPATNANPIDQALENGSLAVNSNLVVIPQSQFVVPGSSKEGRDPFFPNRMDRAETVTPQQPVKSRAEELVLQGISGHVDRRLCVISGRTLAVGNEEDIVLPGGMIRVRCLEINETFVVIELGGERRELHFKAQKQ